MHTVNATALAVPRIILAILEHYWDEETASVQMPEALLPFLPFDRISKKRNSVLVGS